MSTLNAKLVDEAPVNSHTHTPTHGKRVTVPRNETTSRNASTQGEIETDSWLAHG